MTYSKEDCIEAIREARNVLRESPTYSQYRDLDILPSTMVIKDRFGSFNAAKEAAGVETERRRNDKFLYHGFKPGERNYEVVADNTGETRHEIKVHRLIAAAEHGFDAVCGNVVHHANNMQRDNRPENLEIMSREDHTQMHMSENNSGSNGSD